MPQQTEALDDFDLITSHTPAPEPVRRTRSTRIAKPRVTVADEFLDPDTGKPFVRQTSANDSAGVFDIPANLMRAGWDYQWQAIKVLNEPVDPAVHVNMKMQAWRPVHPREMPGQVPPGWTGDTIERGGQILYKRPKYITDEAKAELKAKADQQLEDKFASAQMAPAGTAPRHLAQVRNRVEALPADLRAQYEGEEV